MYYIVIITYFILLIKQIKYIILFILFWSVDAVRCNWPSPVLLVQGCPRFSAPCHGLRHADVALRGTHPGLLPPADTLKALARDLGVPEDIVVRWP